jgi:hypothetical protein
VLNQQLGWQITLLERRYTIMKPSLCLSYAYSILAFADTVELKLLFLPSFCVLALEALYASCGIDQLLLPRKKRVTTRANFHANQIALVRRARLKRASARAVHRNRVIIWMDSFFHFLLAPSDRSVRPALRHTAASLGLH